MTKQERKAYLIAKYMDLNDAVGELSYSKDDIQDELSVNDGYQEHQRTQEKKLTSDE